MFNIGKQKMKYEFETLYLAIVLEKGWITDSNEKGNDLLSFYKEYNGNGTLQISLATSVGEEEFNIKDALKKFQIKESDVKKYKKHGSMVYEFHREDDKMDYTYFNLVRDRIVILTTYTCLKDSIDLNEIYEATKIAQSISINTKN